MKKKKNWVSALNPGPEGPLWKPVFTAGSFPLPCWPWHLVVVAAERVGWWWWWWWCFENQLCGVCLRAGLQTEEGWCLIFNWNMRCSVEECPSDDVLFTSTLFGFVNVSWLKDAQHVLFSSLLEKSVFTSYFSTMRMISCNFLFTAGPLSDPKTILKQAHRSLHCLNVASKGLREWPCKCFIFQSSQAGLCRWNMASHVLIFWH